MVVQGCEICRRIEMIRMGENPYFVEELETGYVVIGDYQRFKGYSFFLCKEHVTELHLLPYEFRMKHLEEMSLVAEAVFNVFRADKMNYDLLGNLDSHVHWHLVPRRIGDIPAKAPIWSLPVEELLNDADRPAEEELQVMAKDLKGEIARLLRIR